jgi:hypothetical protein
LVSWRLAWRRSQEAVRRRARVGADQLSRRRAVDGVVVEEEAEDW